METHLTRTLEGIPGLKAAFRLGLEHHGDSTTPTVEIVALAVSRVRWVTLENVQSQTFRDGWIAKTWTILEMKFEATLLLERGGSISPK